MPRSAVPQKRHLTYELGIFKRATDEPGCRPHNAAPAFQPSLKCEEEPDSAPLSLTLWLDTTSLSGCKHSLHNVPIFFMPLCDLDSEMG